MPGSPQSDDSAFSDHAGAAVDRTALAERELDAALQLLVERAQYITGATGTALALPQGDEMVCRASAGACAPAVGARLQVRSGLTGESIVRRQLLRCDNAETDPRVNLETCRALGIASIVVLPLLRRNGEVRGLFELFSDHPYAFEERDLVALERMAALTLTALDLAEQRHDAAGSSPFRAGQMKPAASASQGPSTSPAKETPNPQSPPLESAVVRPVVNSVPEPVSTASGVFVESSTTTPAGSAAATASQAVPIDVSASPRTVPAEAGPPLDSVKVETLLILPPVVEAAQAEPLPVPEAMRSVRKCACCGFPVSESRTLCLDCENLERLRLEAEKKSRGKAVREANQTGDPTAESATGANPNPEQPQAPEAVEPSPAAIPDEIIPAFLANSQIVEESWMARHVNLLAVMVMIAAILVVVVVFFR